MRGQGTLLSLALVAGILLSWGSWAIARYLPGSSTIAAGGNLTEFRSLDPSEHPVYEQVAAKAFRHITILTKTAAPEGSSATITVFDDQDGDRKSQIQQLSSASATWTRWDHQNANRDISLVVESSATSGAPKATNVEVLIYLSPE
jgi:glycerate kinase